MASIIHSKTSAPELPALLADGFPFFQRSIVWQICPESEPPLNQNLLEKVIANPLQAHQGDTEVSNENALRGSSLTGSLRDTVEKNYAALRDRFEGGKVSV